MSEPRGQRGRPSANLDSARSLDRSGDRVAVGTAESPANPFCDWRNSANKDSNLASAFSPTVQVQFSLVGGEGDIDWSAILKCDDGCGDPVPATGKSKAGGKVITKIVAPQRLA